MIELLCAVAVLPLVILLAVEHYDVKALESSKSWSSQARALASPTEAERWAELLLWNDGEYERHPIVSRIPYAEGSGYVLGEGVDDTWVRGLMKSDDRLRAWNGKRPRRPARVRGGVPSER